MTLLLRPNSVSVSGRPCTISRKKWLVSMMDEPPMMTLCSVSLFFAGDVCAVAELGAQGRVLRGEVQLPHPVHAQRPLPHSLQGRTTQLGHSIDKKTFYFFLTLQCTRKAKYSTSQNMKVLPLSFMRRCKHVGGQN